MKHSLRKTLLFLLLYTALVVAGTMVIGDGAGLYELLKEDGSAAYTIRFDRPEDGVPTLIYGAAPAPGFNWTRPILSPIR